jgi:membrane-associated phospholipid phosphatase
MTRVAVARAVSIAGHPVVHMAVAASIAASSWWQVCAGRWSHVDASVRTERASLNVFLVVVCLLGAVLLWVLTAWRSMPVAMALSGALVLAGLLTARWVKVSLHAAFAAFATALLWPGTLAFAGGILVTAAVIWSRLVLRRHVAADVVAGLLLGVAAGTAYQVWIA